jgi:hypothetical protein
MGERLDARPRDRDSECIRRHYRGEESPLALWSKGRRRLCGVPPPLDRVHRSQEQPLAGLSSRGQGLRLIDHLADFGEAETYMTTSSSTGPSGRPCQPAEEQITERKESASAKRSPTTRSSTPTTCSSVRVTPPAMSASSPERSPDLSNSPTEALSNRRGSPSTHHVDHRSLAQRQDRRGVPLLRQRHIHEPDQPELNTSPTLS